MTGPCCTHFNKDNMKLNKLNDGEGLRYSLNIMYFEFKYMLI